MSDDLKPCPFCGGLPEGPIDATRILGVWRLVHRGCCTLPNFSVERPTPEGAVAAWNRRATPEALAASPEVQVMIEAAEARGMERAAEIAESIRIRIANGPMPEGARFDYEQAIRAEAAALRSFKKGE